MGSEKLTGMGIFDKSLPIQFFRLGARRHQRREPDVCRWVAQSPLLHTLHMATPVNPLYLALPYLSGSDRLVPLDQMLSDQEFPEAEDILLETLKR